MLKTLAAPNTMHLKPDKATGSHPQTMEQGERPKLGKHGRILRPLTLEPDSLLPPIGATGPAPPPRGKRSTAATDGGADKSEAVTSRPALQAQYSLLPPIGTAVPATPPSCKRATVTPDGGAAKRDTGTSRPAGQVGCSLLPPIVAAAPTPPPRGKRATVTSPQMMLKKDLKKMNNVNPTM